MSGNGNIVGEALAAIVEAKASPTIESDVKKLLATLAEGLTDEDLARPCDIAGRPEVTI